MSKQSSDFIDDDLAERAGEVVEDLQDGDDLTEFDSELDDPDDDDSDDSWVDEDEGEDDGETDDEDD